MSAIYQESYRLYTADGEYFIVDIDKGNLVKLAKSKPHLFKPSKIIKSKDSVHYLNVARGQLWREGTDISVQRRASETTMTYKIVPKLKEDQKSMGMMSRRSVAEVPEEGVISEDADEVVSDTGDRDAGSDAVDMHEAVVPSEQALAEQSQPRKTRQPRQPREVSAAPRVKKEQTTKIKSVLIMAGTGSMRAVDTSGNFLPTSNIIKLSGLVQFMTPDTAIIVEDEKGNQMTINVSDAVKAFKAGK